MDGEVGARAAGTGGPVYPARWEADVVLLDGGTAHLRPIIPADADRLRAFHRAQSPHSTYMRFFAPYPELSDRDVRLFTDVDHRRRVALVALIGADIVGVVRYETVGPGEAQVAFNVSDAHQGRGLASVLLEHLAAAARERGIARFTADVLPDNARMLRIFTDAGFQVRTSLDDGVISLALDLAPTDDTVAVALAREQRTEARSIERLLAPTSVAVIGASRVYASVGQTVLRGLLGGGFTGAVHAVNPGVEQVAGRPSHPSVLEVPGPVDLAVIAVPADVVRDVVLECAAKGVRGLLVLSAGFGGTTPEGRRRQDELVAVTRAHGLRLVGPSSFGLVNTDPQVRLNASLATRMPPRGPLGLFSQSGALSPGILDEIERRGLGVSTFVSAGNRADVSGNDLLQFWDQDPDTEVVLLYLESIGNPRKFGRLAWRTARRTPVVSVRSGRSAQGVPLGEVARRGGVPARAVEAMYRQAGVIQVDDLDDLLDVGQLLATQPLPTGERVGVLGNSDALGLLAADACIEAGLVLARPPVDLEPEVAPEAYGQALAELLAEPDVHAVVAVVTPSLTTDTDAVGAALAAAARAGDGTVVASFLGWRGVPAPMRAPDGHQPGSGPSESDPSGSPSSGPALPVRGSVPSYPTPKEAVGALLSAVRYAQWRRRPAGEVPELPDVDADGARRLVDELLADAPEGVTVRGPALGRLLGCYGIALWPSLPVTGEHDLVEAAARLGYPLALKTTVVPLRHRADLADVRLGLPDRTALLTAYRRLVDDLGAVAAEAVVVQPMAAPGVACVVGSVEDPLYGPVVSFGLGGVTSELLGDRAYRSPPLTDLDAAEMVREVAAAPLLFGHRGDPPADVAALQALLLRVARLADDRPEVVELVLDPVLTAPTGLAVLHARLRLARPLARTDARPRQLSG